MKKIGICLATIAIGALCANAGVVSITTAEGDGFDGTLTENYDGYTGTFSTSGHLTSYQYGEIRHMTPVLKWDLSSYEGDSADITDVSIDLGIHAASYVRTYSFMLFTGDDTEILSSMTYTADNPLIDDSYVEEVDCDADFVNLTELYASANVQSGTWTSGSGEAALLTAVQSAVDSDGLLTILLSDNNRALYLKSSADGISPTMNLTTVPEPATLGLMGVAGVAMVAARRRMKR